MKTLNKIAVITFSVFFILSMTASMVLIPNASAQTAAPGNIQTYAFITAGPNPCGVGQTLTVGFWLSMPPPTAGGPFGDRYTNMKVTVTAPDGTNTTLGPFTSDDTGGTTTTYTPTTTGIYSFQMSYPGQTLTGGPNGPNTAAEKVWIGAYVEPAVSNVFEVTVQQSPIGGVSVAPLPTTYWQTPINAMNVNNWYQIGGPYLNIGCRGGTGSHMYNESGNYNPYTTAPTTAHILWTKPEAFGGAIGGDAGGTTTYGNYYSTTQYERKYAPVIINGYDYYTVYPGSSTTPAADICVDLYSGQTVWTDSSSNYGGGSPERTALTSAGLITPILCGQVIDYVSPNQYGGLAYIWTTGVPDGIVSTGTCLNMFDAETGQYILSIVNGTSPSLTVDAGGNLIGYYVNSTAGTQHIMGTLNGNIGPSPIAVTSTGPTLNAWNSTECIMAGNWAASAAGWEWRPPQNGVVPFSDGIQWSVQLPTTYQGNPLPSTPGGYTTGNVYSINSGVIILSSIYTGSIPANSFQAGYEIYMGFSANNGQQLWMQNVTFPPDTSVDLDCTFLAGSGVFITIVKETGQLSGLSMTTGQQVWTDTLTGFNGAPPDPYDTVGGYQGCVANGTLFMFGFGGDVWSVNMLNGKINWYTNTTAIQGPAGTNSPYGVWPIWEQQDIGVAGGVVFLSEGHEYSPPLFLGAQQLALNTTNGNLVWMIDAFDVDPWPAMAYGVMTTINAYDNQIYTFGMGPSKTTITVPQLGVTTATPITITGSVTDVLAGSKQEAVAANFPDGLPCVSDASMTQFMEAVYMQQPMPSNITGVPVTLYVLDSNQNYRSIGTTTTNAQGDYGLTWTPDITGKYTVYAVFGGSQSYYGSSASTYFYAGSPATTPAPAVTPLTGLASNTTVMYAVVAMIIVFIVGIAIILVVLTRKHP